MGEVTGALGSLLSRSMSTLDSNGFSPWSPRSRPLSSFFVLAYVFTWTVWGVGLVLTDRPWRLDSEGLLPIALTVGSFGPTVAALVVTAHVAGRQGLGQLLRAVVRFKVRWWVYVLTFFLPPAILVGVFLLLGIPPAADLGLGLLVINAVVAMPISAVVGGVVFGMGPLGEELGWRGFALPRLLRGRGYISASVLLGLVWSAWHAPLALIADWRPASWSLFIVGYPLSLIAISVVLTVIWRWSNQSVALTILGHAVLNQVGFLATSQNAFDVVDLSQDRLFLAVIAVYAVIAAVFALGASYASRHVGPGLASGG